MKKKILSIVLAVAMTFTLTTIAVAENGSTPPGNTAEIYFDFPEDSDVTPGEFSWELISGSFEFEDADATLEAVEVSSEDPAELKFNLADAAGAVQVQIGPFYIGGYETMQGFELTLSGTYEYIGLEGTTDVHEIVIGAGKPAETIVEVDALGVAYLTVVEIDADLYASEGTATRAGQATATLTWTTLTLETP